MNRNSIISQWPKHVLDVNLEAAGDAHMQRWYLHSNEVFHEIKDRLSWSWHPMHVGTLIECVNDDVDGLLGDNFEHLL